MEQNLEPKVLDKMITLSGFIFLDYARDCAIEAFNEGRQSVIENASKLNWEDVGIYGQHGMYLNVCRVHKPLGDFLIRQWFHPKDIELFFLDENIRGEFKSVNEAKEYAKKMYENEIKKVLGV